MKSNTQQWHNTVGIAVGCLLHSSLMGLIRSLLARVTCKHEQLHNNNNNNKIQTVKIFSNDIHMKFGLGKCA
jgi:hypothetical protein